MGLITLFVPFWAELIPFSFLVSILELSNMQNPTELSTSTIFRGREDK